MFSYSLYLFDDRIPLHLGLAVRFQCLEVPVCLTDLVEEYHEEFCQLLKLSAGGVFANVIHRVQTVSFGSSVLCGGYFISDKRSLGTPCLLQLLPALWLPVPSSLLFSPRFR